MHGRDIKTRYFGSILIFAIKEGLVFYQTRSNAIILQGALPAHCIVKVERLKTGQVLYERRYLSPRPPPKISLKHDLNLTKGNDQSGSTVEHQPVGKLVQQSLGETLQAGSSKPTQFPKPIEDRTGKPVTQEIVGTSQGELSSSDRTVELVKDEDKRVMKDPDRTGKPVEGSSHKVQEVGSLEHRDDADKFNLAMDDENIDFNISGVPNAMVKRSHSINVHNLIQQIENHPQRQALQDDLQQHRAFNPFSKESKDAIMAAGNTELCEIVDVEPKSQCRACRTYCSAGIVYCTYGHLMKDDTTENKKYISSVLDLFSIPNFYIRKARPHGHRYGKAPGCKEYHTTNQLQKRCRKKKYDNIRDRFIRDKFFRKTMIELGRSEEIILEMDRLASERMDSSKYENWTCIGSHDQFSALYGIEIRNWSVNQDNSQSWVQISNGTVKYVIDSIEDNTEIFADPQEEQVPQTSIKVVAARSKAKAKPQPRGLVGTTTTIPIHERRWIDIEPSEQNLASYDLSKKVVNLLRHNQTLQREDDGAIEFLQVKIPSSKSSFTNTALV